MLKLKFGGSVSNISIIVFIISNSKYLLLIELDESVLISFVCLFVFSLYS